MNWYFEENGVSHGPVTEQVLATRVQSKGIAPETLIWHTGLDEWKTVHQLRPEWLQTDQPKKTKPEPEDPAATEEKGGFFKKIFGGKK